MTTYPEQFADASPNREDGRGLGRLNVQISEVLNTVIDPLCDERRGSAEHCRDGTRP
jgi:hypothetical protein